MKPGRIPTPTELERMVPPIEVYLANLNADKLKKLARRWAGKAAYKMTKDQALTAVKEGFGDPQVVRGLAADLSDFERAGLGLVKLRGGRTAYAEELAGELLMLGLPFKGSAGFQGYGHDDAHYAALNALLEAGLLIRIDGGGQPIGQYYPCLAVFADAQLLGEGTPLPPKSLDLQPLAQGRAEFVRRPGEVLLHLVAFTQALSRVGLMALSAKGLRTKPAVARLAKTLGWTAAPADGSPTPLPDVLGFYLSLFEAAGMLVVDSTNRTLVLQQDQADELLAMPYAEQARRWAQAYRRLVHWVEYVPPRVYLYGDHEAIGPSKFNTLRAALLLGLAALPEPGAWYRLEDLSDAIYERIGPYFSLGYRSHFYPPYKTPPEQVPLLRAQWEREQHAQWREREQVWIGHALAGPLFHLGLVELGYIPGEGVLLPNAFHLTEAGRAATASLFRSEAQPVPAAMPASPCAVVQPNFDVIVYLDGADPKQLSFIERIAERRQADAATAVYRLTREATYRALESGITATALIATLQAASRHPLPDSVVRTLTDWAARRDRLSVCLNARILEFQNQAARDAALAAGQLSGVAVGERFVQVASLASGFRPSSTIAYEPALPQCLTASETGEIAIDPDARDLLIDGELAGYCEPLAADDCRWRITGESVRRAKARGWTAKDILNRLTRRSRRPLPPILACAIAAWSGGSAAPGPLSVPTVPILQVTDREVAKALSASRVFKPYLLGQLGAHAFLVKPGREAELSVKLAELGFAVGTETLPALGASEQTV